MTITKKIGLIAGLVTCAVGFVPLLVLSIATGAFFPRSKVNVPLTLVPSVLFGDSLLLPLFNGYAFCVLSRAFAVSFPRKMKWLLGIGAILSVTVSIAANVQVHRLWLRNGNTGYIALKPATMSSAGRWHLVFSSVEMAFVLWFLFVCFLWRKDRARIDRAAALRAWRYFVCYSALTVGDFSVWHLVISPESGYAFSDSIALSLLPLASLSYGGLVCAIPK